MPNWNKILGCTLLSTSLVLTSISPATAKTTVMSATTSNKETRVNTYQDMHSHSQYEDELLPFMSKHEAGPFDAGLVNEEKVIDILIEQGIIVETDSEATKEKKVKKYIQSRAEQAEKIAISAEEERSAIFKAAGEKEVPAKPPIDSKKVAFHSQGGPTQIDQVLVILIDFPDYKHSQITKSDNPVLFYENYTKEHYENMIFGDHFLGEKGQEHISMKRYYEEQSGGSYSIDGIVTDWYTASNPASYYGANSGSGGNDVRPRDLIKEALNKAALDPKIDLRRFDQEDIYDYDGDGNYRERDGIIDHLMVVHAGPGEESGGGGLGANAIWSHKWSLGTSYIIPGTSGEGISRFGGSLAASAYTIQPEDGAVGVFAHEFGHDLGLPDEYDITYSANGVGAPTAYWSIMSQGSWAGLHRGTEPTGFSPGNKEYLQKKYPMLNWLQAPEYSLQDLKREDITLMLDQASDKGPNADAVKISLPPKATGGTTPYSGYYSYFSGKGNNLYNEMYTTIDLIGATEASLSFKAYYDIEQGYDFAYVHVNGEPISGTITNDARQITGKSSGWIDANFNLSAFVGKEIELSFLYETDSIIEGPGLYIDELMVKKDGQIIVSDPAEEESSFNLEGFSVQDVVMPTKLHEHYYLIEWRNHSGVDEALAHLPVGSSRMTYDPGMVVWYVDNSFTNNSVGTHPGDGFIGVVDAQQATAKFGSTSASTAYQVQDAAFSLNATDAHSFLSLPSQPANPTFSDLQDYSNPGQIYAGRNVTDYGVNVTVSGQADDMSTGTITISYDNFSPTLSFDGVKNSYSLQDGQNHLEATMTVSDQNYGEKVKVRSSIRTNTHQTLLTNTQYFKSLKQEEILNTSFPLTSLPSGDYFFVIEVSDEQDSVMEEIPFTIVEEDSVVSEVSVDRNGRTTSGKTANVQINASNVQPDSLEYAWSPSISTPSTGWQPFMNGSTVSISDEDGIWYLHVKGRNMSNQPISYTSKGYLLDNTKPVISLKGSHPFALEAGFPFTEPGFSATDNIDGTLTGKVTVSGEINHTALGEYKVTYSVTDAAGNIASTSRTVIVQDTTKPLLELMGASTVSLPYATRFVEPGYTATDQLDGNLAGDVKISGSVNEFSPGAYTLTYTVSDSSGNTTVKKRTIKVEVPPFKEVQQVAGGDRVKTAVKVSEHMYPTAGTAETVVITTGFNFPDALSAGPLASSLKAPILPTNQKGELSSETLNEINRLGAKNAYLIGGETAVSNKVITQLQSAGISRSNVERLSGSSRYGTNLAILSELQKLGFTGNGVFLATGQNYADALSAAAIAGREQIPILLTDGKSLSSESLRVLTNEKVYVLGGSAAIPSEIVSQAKKVATSVDRLAGSNRYGTLVSLLNKFQPSTHHLFIASGQNFPDALSAAPYVTLNDGILLLVEKDKLPGDVDRFLTSYVKTNKISTVQVLGGDSAVSSNVRKQLSNKVK